MIKLLEIPTIQLEQRIKKELVENPALEDENLNNDTAEDSDDDLPEDKDNDNEEFSIEEYLKDDDIPSYKLATSNYSRNDEKREIPFSIGSTFLEYLESQLGLRKLDDKQKILSEYIIGNIDEDGYLRREIYAIVDDIAFVRNVTTDEEELMEILDIIQDFDPPGVGARDLQECLLLQIERKDFSGQNGKNVKLAEKILRNNFREFTKKHYQKIIGKLNITEDQLKGAIDEIIKLNPKPGSAHSDPHNKTLHQIVPDFILENNEGDLQLSLNSWNAPYLKVNRTYADMLISFSKSKNKKSKQQRDTISFVKQKLDSARWFIDAIRQRQTTLILTMKAIIDYQHDYFFEGDEKKLKPMILKDIADITDLDISTVSRVANSKHIQTHFGIFSLKYFFSESMQTNTGEEVSSREIKKILEECISSENKRKPLTDEKLAKILQEKNYLIARRTVAKYREQLNIPVARLRKELT